MKIKAVQIQTTRLQELRSFYGNTLGLKELNKAEFQIGSSQLMLKETTEDPGIYHFAFSIPCNQIREAMAWLEGNGVTLVPDEKGETLMNFSRWNAKASYFLDPAGNIVELIARRDLQNESEAAFNPAALLDISEVGIVTDDVLAWNAQAEAQFGIKPFEKSPPRSDFSALGTDSGLFIVVPEGRIWYMTDTPASKQPLEVRFENRVGEPFELNL